jgi:hypothetical protein
MEDEDPTPRVLPRWIELEYKVSLKYIAKVQRRSANRCPKGKADLLLLGLHSFAYPNIAPLQVRGPRHVRRNAPLKRGGRRPHRRASLLPPAPAQAPRQVCAACHERGVPKLTQDRVGACVPARSQGAAGALAFRRRCRCVWVLPFRRACLFSHSVHCATRRVSLVFQMRDP